MRNSSRLVVLPFVALSAPLFGQTAESQQRQIDGYYWVCKAQLGNDQYPFRAQFNLDDSGRPIGFLASLARFDAQDSRFWGQRPADVSKDATHVRWSLDWSYRNDTFTSVSAVPDPKFEDASLSLDFSSWRKLPNAVAMRIGPNQGVTYSGYSHLYSFSLRHVGRKTGATFSFGLAVVLAYARSSTTLRWSILRPALLSSNDYVSPLGEGDIDLKPIVAAAKEFAELRSMLAIKIADYRNQCQREPIYYNPDGEIVTTGQPR
jgi:hypothetical protein